MMYIPIQESLIFVGGEVNLGILDIYIVYLYFIYIPYVDPTMGSYLGDLFVKDRLKLDDCVIWVERLR